MPYFIDQTWHKSTTTHKHNHHLPHLWLFFHYPHSYHLHHHQPHFITFQWGMPWVERRPPRSWRSTAKPSSSRLRSESPTSSRTTRGWCCWNPRRSSTTAWGPSRWRSTGSWRPRGSTFWWSCRARRRWRRGGCGRWSTWAPRTGWRAWCWRGGLRPTSPSWRARGWKGRRRAECGWGWGWRRRRWRGWCAAAKRRPRRRRRSLDSAWPKPARLQNHVRYLHASKM